MTTPSKADAVKLTKAQRQLLLDIEGGSCGVAESYAPARRLIELGLAQWKPGKYADYLQITPAGRAILGDTP